MKDEVISDFIFKIEHELTIGFIGGSFTDKEDECKVDYVLTCLLKYVVLKKEKIDRRRGLLFFQLYSQTNS